MVNKTNGKIGVVTVTYNSGKVIDEFMDSMLAQDYQNYTLYIIDNASADDTLSKVSKYPDERIVVIPNQDNVGVAAGNNQGIVDSIKNDCSHVLLINNDTVFDPDLLSNLLAGLSEYNCPMIVPKIMFHHDPNEIWCAGGYFDTRFTGEGKAYGTGEIDKGQYDKAMPISFAATCCMLITIDVFNIVGLMDEKYFVYYDDTDFCWRAMKQQQVLYYEPRIKMLHKAGSLTGTGSSFTTYYSTRNKIYYVRKNLPILSQILMLIICQAISFKRLIINRDSLSLFFLRQKAFSDGLKLSTLTADI
jgi:GT2 family glycosyltransferase